MSFRRAYICIKPIQMYRFLRGEKTIVCFIRMILNNPDILLLDEPTNHIDISTKEILEESLRDYKGTMLIVSHDRYFINRIATRLLIIDNKKLSSYIGNYDDYKRKQESTN